MAEAEGLFGSAPGSPRPAAAAPASTAARREKLYIYDAAAVQALNPYGSSQFTGESTKSVWAMVSKGSRKAAFHSELAAKDNWRVGVGISRTAETLLEGIAQLQTDNMKKVLRPEILKLAVDEATALEPYLHILNFGKGSEKEAVTASLSGMKRRKVSTAAAPPAIAEVEEAADKLREWLQKGASPLRGILAILAANGALWGAHVAEKVARAAVLHKPLESPQLRAAVVARRKEPAAASSSATGADDARGLLS